MPGPKLKMISMPDAPDHGPYCFACAVLFKGSLFRPAAVQRRVQEALADEGRTKPVFVGPPDPDKAYAEVNPMVTWGPHPLAGGQVVPVCWDHAPAVDGEQPPPEEQQQAPGLVVPGQQDRRRPGLS